MVVIILISIFAYLYFSKTYRLVFFEWRKITKQVQEISSDEVGKAIKTQQVKIAPLTNFVHSFSNEATRSGVAISGAIVSKENRTLKIWDQKKYLPVVLSENAQIKTIGNPLSNLEKIKIGMRVVIYDLRIEDDFVVAGGIFETRR